MDIKIIVATHKSFIMPADRMYMPVHVGRNLAENWQESELAGYIGDNTGDNISSKNKNYCELTALYWAWKNLNAEYIGLTHYRRHFRGSKGSDKWQSTLSNQKAEKLLKEYDVILPKQRNYFIESTYAQYIHAHHRQDLDKTLEIIKRDYPDYVHAWDKVMKSTKGHRFNMFIMKTDVFNIYMEWMFDILFKLEQVLDISHYSDYDKRVFGFVSERLLDVWITANNINYTELPVINMEKQNWPKKIYNFLKRKFVGK